MFVCDAGRIREVLREVEAERVRQERLKSEGKFPWSCADNYDPSVPYAMPISHAAKFAVLAEEFGEVAREVCELQNPYGKGDDRKLRQELLQVAAVAVAWAESL